MAARTVWPSVKKWLPARDEHCDYWWSLAGPQLAVLLHNSGYSQPSQYEVLLFVYHHIVPLLGLAPSSRPTEERLSVERTRPERLDYLASRTERLEYSWRWPEPGDKPEIRIGVKPWSRLAGTAVDPLNLMAATELLVSMAAQVPSLDLTLFDHFVSKLYDAEKHKYLGARECQGLPWVCCTGFEFLSDSILPKAYFFPCKLGHGSNLPLEAWEEAFTSAPMRSPALDTVLSFIKTAAPGLNLNLDLRWIAIDAVNPAQTRLKLYCTSSNPTLESIGSVLTMGGQVAMQSTVLDQIWELLAAICGLPVDFPRGKALPCLPSTKDVSSESRCVFLYYFDIQTGPVADPHVKLYFPAWNYASDEQIAAGLSGWMKKYGRGQFVDAYWDALHEIIPHRRLDEVGATGTFCAAQMMISVMARNSKLQVTSYISPEAHHPQRRT